MTTRSLWALVRQNIRRARRSFVLSVLGIAVGISSLVFFLGLSAGVRAVLLGKVFPLDLVEVVPPKSNLDSGGLSSLFSMGSGAGPKLDDAAIAQLSGRSEVVAAYRRMRMAFPARASGGKELLGRDLHGELVAEGIDVAAVAGESLAPLAFDDQPGSQTACATDVDCRAPEYCPVDSLRCERPVPAVLSPFLLEIYNSAIAPSHRLPRINRFLADRFRGFTFEVELGQSFFGRIAPSSVPSKTRRIMLVGIARRSAQLAVTVPLATMQRWNKEWGGTQGATADYSSVLLQLRPNADVPRLSEKVRELGLELSDSGAEKVGLLITLITLLFALVSFAIVAVATVNIAQSFFRVVAERRRELGLLRALGASSASVRRLVLCEAAVIGLLGGLLGVAFGRFGAWLADTLANRYVPDFPFRPDSFFSFSWLLVGGAILCAVLACVAGAYWPARAAARLDPAETLASS